MDGALHCDARIALARRVSKGRHRRAQDLGGSHGKRGGAVIAALAPLAKLRSNAHLGYDKNVSRLKSPADN